MPMIPAIIGAMRPRTIMDLLMTDAEQRPIPHFAVPIAEPVHDKITPHAMPRNPKNGVHAGQTESSNGSTELIILQFDVSTLWGIFNSIFPPAERLLDRPIFCKVMLCIFLCF